MSLQRYKIQALLITPNDALATYLWENLHEHYDVMVPTHEYSVDAAVGLLVPDIAVLDLIDDSTALTWIRQIHALSPHTQMVVLAHRHAPNAILQAMQAGAVGYVYVHQIATMLRQTIQTTMEGQAYVDAALAREIRSYVHSNASLEIALTERERAILRYLVIGWTYTQIAHQECLPITVIYNHLGNIILKIGHDSAEQGDGALGDAVSQADMAVPDITLLHNKSRRTLNK